VCCGISAASIAYFTCNLLILPSSIISCISCSG